MPIIDPGLRSQLAKKLSAELGGEVRVWLFISKHKEQCPFCGTVAGLVEEFCGIDGRLKLFVYDIDDHQKEARLLGVERVPAILLQGASATGVYYYGMPTGYEFGSLVEDVIDLSNSRSRLSDRSREAVQGIESEVDIKVFVTPTCPYCPGAVRMAHQIAMENTKVKASMIEATEFSELSERYGVMGVPKVVINDRVSFEGAVQEGEFIEHIRRALK